jgi:hypothetical protein
MIKMNIHKHLNPRETWTNRFDHNSVNSEPISIKKIAAWSWEAGQPVATQVWSNIWLQPVQNSPRKQ